MLALTISSRSSFFLLSARSYRRLQMISSSISFSNKWTRRLWPLSFSFCGPQWSSRFHLFLKKRKCNPGECKFSFQKRIKKSVVADATLKTLFILFLIKKNLIHSPGLLFFSLLFLLMRPLSLSYISEAS